MSERLDTQDVELIATRVLSLLRTTTEPSVRLVDARSQRGQMPRSPTGSVDTVVLTDGTRAFHLRFNADAGANG